MDNRIIAETLSSNQVTETVPRERAEDPSRAGSVTALAMCGSAIFDIGVVLAACGFHRTPEFLVAGAIIGVIGLCVARYALTAMTKHGSFILAGFNLVGMSVAAWICFWYGSQLWRVEQALVPMAAFLAALISGIVYAFAGIAGVPIGCVWERIEAGRGRVKVLGCGKEH
jgi:hypothetical protein